MNADDGIVRSMYRIGVIVNPTAGNGAGHLAGEKALDLLSRAGFLVTELTGSSFEQARQNARFALARSEVDAMVVVGGDGMVHLGTNLCAGTDVALGIIPCGTGNDAAELLGMPLNDVAAAVAMISNTIEAPRSVDAVLATASDHQFWFFGTLSAGFDALVNRRANSIGFPRGASRYRVALFLELAKFKSLHYRIEVDGEVRELDAMLCTIANSSQYGGGMKIVPHARLDDGMLDLLILHAISRRELVKVFPKVYTGEHVTHPAVEFLRGRTISISSGSTPAFADGEPVGTAPIKASVVPGALRVLAPVA